MQRISRAGPYLYAIAIIAFAVTQLVTVNFLTSLFPVPVTLPGRKIFLYLISILLIIAGAGIIGFEKEKAALAAGLIFFLLLLFPHFASLLQNLYNGGGWTVFGETAAYCGGALIIAEQYSGRQTEPVRRSRFLYSTFKSGPYFFGIALFIFGVQHFLYADYIETLIPKWIPFPVFWNYLVGFAFIAGSMSILLKIKTRLASTLLGFMFLFWFIFVHAPRVIAMPHQETEWTSLFVALGMGGIFFTLTAKRA